MEKDQFWNKERFKEDRKGYDASAALTSFFIFSGTALLCSLFDVNYLIPLAFFIGVLSFLLLKRHFFFKWKNDLLFYRKISETKFNKLCKEADPEELRYFSIKGITFLSVLFCLLLGGAFYGKFKNDELKENPILTTGKIVSTHLAKNICDAIIEYQVGKETFTTALDVDYRGWEFYYKESHRKVLIGDEFRVRYSSKDPSNSEPVGKLPVNK